MSAAAVLRGPIDAVAIGASAGGVQALCQVLPALPEGSDAAVFIVLHLPRATRSLLVDVLAPKCRLQVMEARDKEPVLPGHVYVAPPDYHLLIDAGPSLALSVDEPVHYARPSIDVLFESAADIYGARLLGMVLTGANADGAAGLAAIHRAGGTAVIQDPDGAYASLMPASAIQLSPTGVVLKLEEIGDLFRTLDGGGGA